MQCAVLADLSVEKNELTADHRALGSVLVGLPLGLVIAVVWTVARRLEDAP